MRKIAFLLPLFLVMLSCGPEQTARDREDQVRDEIVREKAQELRRFEGTYKGRIVGSEINTDAILEIRVITEWVFNVGTNSNIAVTQLVGGIRYSLSAGDKLTLVSFRNGDYDSSTNQIRLIGQAPRVANALVTIVLDVNGDTLNGNYQIWGQVFSESKVTFVRENK